MLPQSLNWGLNLAKKMQQLILSTETRTEKQVNTQHPPTLMGTFELDSYTSNFFK